MFVEILSNRLSEKTATASGTKSVENWSTDCKVSMWSTIIVLWKQTCSLTATTSTNRFRGNFFSLLRQAFQYNCTSTPIFSNQRFNRYTFCRRNGKRMGIYRISRQQVTRIDHITKHFSGPMQHKIWFVVRRSLKLTVYPSKRFLPTTR